MSALRLKHLVHEAMATVPTFSNMELVCLNVGVAGCSALYGVQEIFERGLITYVDAEVLSLLIVVFETPNDLRLCHSPLKMHRLGGKQP
jgi:hypothetical protein